MYVNRCALTGGVRRCSVGVKYGGSVLASQHLTCLACCLLASVGGIRGVARL